MIMDIGFIGLGNMGLPMARILLKAGHALTVYNRTRSKADGLAREGARVASSPADAANCEVLLTMLPGDAEVERVVYGGLLEALPRDAVHCGMSTLSVALSERVAAAHDRAGQNYVAAPVFGRPDAAAAGMLFILAAGPGTAIGRCQPLFDVLGQRTFRIGPAQPQANLIKLAGNSLIASMMESLGEAFALVRKGGVDSHLFQEILTNSLFAAPAYKTYGTIIADEKYESVGFKTSLALKDMRLALAAADAETVPMPVASLLHDHFISAVAQGQGDIDWSNLARMAARNAGL
jgi:3-hydroxyisobutyrate dehydrogenase-like beta-hydroxyacid dehydrogenase